VLVSWWKERGGRRKRGYPTVKRENEERREGKGWANTHRLPNETSQLRGGLRIKLLKKEDITGPYRYPAQKR